MYKILLYDCHEGLLTLFSKLDAEFDAIPYHEWSRWRLHYRPKPKNIRFISEPQGPYDLAILFNRHTQFVRFKNFGLNIPVILQFATSRCNEPDLSGLEDVPLVYCGYRQKEEYGVDGKVIYYGIDTEEFKGYEGSINSVLTVVTDFRSRDRVTGYSFYERLVRGLMATNYGRQDDGLPSLISRDYEHLKSLYRDYTVFLDTALHSPLSMSMLEAMATGMPVVTHPHDDTPLIIENEVNGIISGDEDYLREKLRELLWDKKYGQRLGDAARETIKARFSIEQFKKSWTELIERTVKAWK